MLIRGNKHTVIVFIKLQGFQLFLKRKFFEKRIGGFVAYHGVLLVLPVYVKIRERSARMPAGYSLQAGD